MKITHVQSLELEIKEKDKQIIELASKIQELLEENENLKIACDDYNNLMRECIFDEFR